MANKNPRTDHLKDDQFPSEGKELTAKSSDTITVRFNKEDIEVIEAIAESKGVRKSEVVREFTLEKIGE